MLHPGCMYLEMIVELLSMLHPGFMYLEMIVELLFMLHPGFMYLEMIVELLSMLHPGFMYLEMIVELVSGAEILLTQRADQRPFPSVIINRRSHFTLLSENNQTVTVQFEVIGNQRHLRELQIIQTKTRSYLELKKKLLFTQTIK